jgi:NAD(P)-dependent dehydrogenase (short-subunit alcohol dehydrogenase family)
MYGLNGRTALITGAAAGIGRRIATRLAEEGCNIGILDIDRVGAEETANQVEGLGSRCLVLPGDVGDRDQVTMAAAKLEKEFGRIDITSNNAAIVTVGPLVDQDIEEWRNVFRINVEGVLNVCQAVVPGMVARKAGRIINTASWFGKIGKPRYGAYSASKFSVIGITQSLAAELALTGVTVNAVCPGTIVGTRMRDEADRRSIEQGLPTARERAGQIPLGRVGVPDDIARVVAFLASDESAYMTGQSINVTGGLWMH